MESKVRIRLATNNDLPELVRLESLAFASDRFSEEQIDYQLTRAHSTILIAERKQQVLGAAYMLWRKGVPSGRLYSIAVDPASHGQGIGALLLEECEQETVRRGRQRVSLEVRVDNTRAIEFYERHDYRTIARLPDYYEDGSPGLKMIKQLSNGARLRRRFKVPYVRQSLDFTCGPASLLMALSYFDPKLDADQVQELRLWQQATLVFMTSGIGGTGPFGLAAAAAERNHKVRIIISTLQAPFLKSVRAAGKREVMQLMHEDQKERAIEAGVALSSYDFGVEDIISMLCRDYLPLVLISSYRLTGSRTPHWVLVTGFDSNYLYFHDPDADSYRSRRGKGRDLPVTHAEFNRMSRYGKEAFRCTICVGPHKR